MILRAWDGSADMLTRAADLYAEVFAEPPYDEDVAGSRASFIERTERYAARKPEFRLVVAEEGTGLVGLVMGSGAGQGDWWRDRVAESVPAPVVQGWLDEECFFVAELAVASAHRRTGIAASLMARALDGLPYDAAVLTCYSAAAATRRFYAALGWQELAVDFRVADSPALCLLGIRLPSS